ncbi:MAG: hypothetical protein HAW60_01330 [Bdellovibrionales bacterium]|nr:hypothetical protein [Bdellovibrionales bacterium]
MKFFIFIFILLPQVADAKLFVNKNITGASNISFDKNDNVTIFGGTSFNITNDDSECSAQGSDDDSALGELLSTCNSCTNQFQSCNTNRISDNLILGISFYVDSAPAIGPILITTEQGVEIEQSSFYGNQEPAEPGQVVTAYVEWTELCSVNGTGFCNESAGNIKIKIGIDSDEDGTINTKEGGFVTVKIQNPNKSQDANLSSLDCAKAGVCNFKIFSGNKKSFIGQIKKSKKFPNWEDSIFNQLRVFYSSEGFNKVTPLSNSVDISISPDTSLEEEFIVGPLENGIQYYFRVAVVDESNNIAFITSDEQISNVCSGVEKLTASQCDSCPYCSTPADVVGILTKDLNCFITTATYGSNQSSLVRLFRKFRNKILLKFKFGIWLTKKYYKWGAKGSLVLEKYPVLKIFSGLILTPLAILVWISLNFFYFLSILLSLSSLLLGLKIFLKKNKIVTAVSLLIFSIFLSYPTQNIKAKSILYKKNNYLLKSKTNYLNAKYEFYSIQVGSYTPLNLTGGQSSYTEVYGLSKKFMMLLSYEKNIFSSFGLLSFDLGSGLMSATAYGLKSNNLSERSHEKLLFFLIPNHVSLIYRFQYSSNPFISPYIKAGITAFGIIESPQSSGAQIKLALAPASHMAAGLGINMINWSSSKKELRNDYDMHSFFIFAEYKVYKTLSKKFNLSNNMVSVGLTLGF